MTDSIVGDVDLGIHEEEKPVEDSRATVEVVRKDTLTGERPEGIADDMWNADSREVDQTALIDGYKNGEKRILDLRQQISKGANKAPESVEGYEVEYADEIKEVFGGEDQRGLDVAKKAALDAGISNEAFNKFINTYGKGIIDGGLLNPPELTEEQQTEADDKFKTEQMEILGEEGKRSLDRLTDRISTLYKKGSLTPDDVEAFKDVAYDAKGVLFLDKFISLHNNDKMIPTQHVIDEGMLTREQLDAMGSDTRMSDPAFRAKRTAGYRALDERGVLSR